MYLKYFVDRTKAWQSRLEWLQSIPVDPLMMNLACPQGSLYWVIRLVLVVVVPSLVPGTGPQLIRVYTRNDFHFLIWITTQSEIGIISSVAASTRLSLGSHHPWWDSVCAYFRFVFFSERNLPKFYTKMFVSYHYNTNQNMHTSGPSLLPAGVSNELYLYGALARRNRERGERRAGWGRVHRGAREGVPPFIFIYCVDIMTFASSISLCIFWFVL